MIVGEFNQPKRLGDQVTITFATDIHISGIYWYDNDPKSPPEVPVAEAGWSFMGTPGPLTGDKQAVWTTANITTNSVSYSAGDDSGGIDFCFTPKQMGEAARAAPPATGRTISQPGAPAVTARTRPSSRSSTSRTALAWIASPC